MKTKSFSIPKTTNDLRIRHLKVLTNPVYQDELSLEEVAQFMSEFTGEHLNDIRMIDAKDLINMYVHVKTIYSDIRINPPVKEITLNGMVYELIDPHKVGSGWHMDFSKGDINKDPIWLACLFYYPKGVKYGQTDENKNLLHPIKDRYNTFEREMNLQTFLNASAFFLTKIEKSIRQSTEIQKSIQKVVKILKPFSGKKSLT